MVGLKEFQIQCRNILIHRCGDLEAFADDGLRVRLDSGETTWKFDIAFRNAAGDFVVAKCCPGLAGGLANFAYKVELLRKQSNQPAAGIFFAKRPQWVDVDKGAADFEGISFAVLGDETILPELAISFHRYDRDRERRCIELAIDIPSPPATSNSMNEVSQLVSAVVEKRNPDAQFRLAELIDGESVDGIAFHLLRAAAEQGHAEACMNLCYYSLEFGGTEADAIEWYRKGRKLGHPHDASSLTIFSPHPKFSPTTKGLKRILRSAKAGDVDSQIFLAECYATGTYGFPISFFESYAWFAVAARHVPGFPLPEEHGNDWNTPARKIRLLESVFDEDELALAHSLARDHFQKYPPRS